MLFTLKTGTYLNRLTGFPPRESSPYRLILDTGITQIGA